MKRVVASLADSDRLRSDRAPNAVREKLVGADFEAWPRRALSDLHQVVVVQVSALSPKVLGIYTMRFTSLRSLEIIKVGHRQTSIKLLLHGFLGCKNLRICE